MGKSAPTPPPAPDPYATASAQATANAQTATGQTLLNNPNVYTPYGSSVTTQTGSQTFTNSDGSTYTLPTFTNTQTLSNDQQNILNQNTALTEDMNQVAFGALGQVGATLASPVTSDQLSPLQMSAGQTPALQGTYNAGNPIASQYDEGPQLQYHYDQGGNIQTSVPYSLASTNANQSANAPTQLGQTATQVLGSLGNTDFTTATNNATNAVLARLQPTIDQQTQNLQAQLANQGLTQGSAAYNAALLQNNQANNDLYLGAVQTGDQEQQALYGEQLSSGQFQNAAQQQEYNQLLGQGQFAQAGIAQNNAANLAQANYGLSATEANNTSALNAGTFANTAQAQQNAQNAAQAGFYNQAVGQQNAQNAAEAEFWNQAQAQQNAQNAAAAGFYDQTANQAYQNQLAGASFANQAAGQQYTQALGLQNQQINEIDALRSGSQVQNPSLPGYSAATLDQTPLSSDVYSSASLAQQAYNTQAQLAGQNNAALGGVVGSLGKLAIKSDRRLKRDIERVATARNGLPIYLFRYRGREGWYLGFMADEVAALHPEAVANDSDGFASVDYERAVA